MRSKSGFTMVEALIVMTVIAVLASITVVAYTKVQQDTRNTTRKGNATVIAEALEEYYRKNGEYPSVRSLVNNYPENTAAVVGAKLDVNPSALKMPKMPSSSTNALVSAATPTNDYIAYIAQSGINNNSCQSVLTGGCDEFTLRYIEEAGNTVNIESRHKGRPSDLPTSPDAPSKPTLATSLAGTNVVATATAQECETGSMVKKYSFRHRTNGGSWGAYSNWDASATYVIPGTQGNTYDFQAVTRCDNGSTPGVTSPESDIATYQYAITPPSAPTVTVNLSGSNALATSTAVSCPASTTAQYAFRSRVNDGTWSSYSAWSSGLTSSQAAAQGSKYGYQAKAVCQLGSVMSSEATSTEGTYIRPISTPAAPTANNSTVGNTTTWTINATSCPAGTTAEYQEQDSADWGYTSSWLGPYGSSFTGSSWNTSSQGYQYTEAFQTRCKSNYHTSNWSTSGSSSYIRPITAPGAPSNFNATLAADRRSTNWTWTAPSCASGLQGWQSNSARWPPGAYGGWTTPGYWAASWSQVIVDGNGQWQVIPAGTQHQIKSQYECVNTTTGRTSAWGPVGESGIFTAP